MSAKSSCPTSIGIKNRENDAPMMKANQNDQNETRQSNSNVVQRIAARLARVEEKFSKYPVIENYLQNNKVSNTTLEDKFKFIELAGAKLNEKITTTDNSLLTSIEDSVLMIEKQLFKNSNFGKDDLRNRILRIGRYQESNYKTIKQQIDNLIADPDVSFQVMKHILTNISRQLNEQSQIQNNDFDNIETLKTITKVAYSPQSTLEMLRDSLKKSLGIQQNSQTKIQELHRKTQYLEDQLHIAMKSANQPQEHSEDLSIITETRNFSNNNYPKLSYINSTPTRSPRQQGRITTYQSAYTPSPRKSRAFDLDDDSEMDSFALREAFEPEVKDQYQDQLDQINAQMRRQGMSLRDINAANEIFTDCFIDLRSKILVQQDTISSLEKDRKIANALREKLAQQEALIQKLQTALKESIKESPEYKKQLKTIQLLTVKLNQAKNKIVFNQENMQKIKNQLQEKEDQRKRTETENNNLKKDIEMIHQALELSAVDAENMRNLEIKSKGIKGLIDRLKKTEQMCEDQQNKLFNMHNLIVKLRNRLTSNGIQIPEEEQVDIYYQIPDQNTKRRSINGSASYTASFNDRSFAVDEDNSSVHSQSNQTQERRNSISNKQADKTKNSKQNNKSGSQNQQSLSESNNENSLNDIIINSRSTDNSNDTSINSEISNTSNNNNSISSGNNDIINNGKNNFTEELQKMKIKCETQENQIKTLKEENDRLTKTLNLTKEEEKKKYEGEINTLNKRIIKLESDKQIIPQISIKSSPHIESIQNHITKLQTESETKMLAIEKKLAEMDQGIKNFISANKGLGFSSRKDRKTIDELSQNLQLANNTIITLRDEKDSLLRILCSESIRSKITDDKINKSDLPKDASTDRFQLNLQQIDEQVTCQIDDVKNVKTSILNENMKEAF